MSLTELSYYVRKFAPFAILVLLILLILYYLFKLLFLSLQPVTTTSIYLDPIFGKIKKPILNNVVKSSGLIYTLDTIEGKPLTATKSANVYFLPPTSTRFGYREKIYLIAKTLGFDTEVTKHTLNGKEAIFKDSKQTLTVDITNFNFTYEYDFENEPQIFQNVIIPEKNEYENRAIAFLKDAGRYPEELAKGKTNSILVTYNPAIKEMRLVEKPESANMVEVDFYRPDLEQYPIVSPSYFNSQNYVMMVFYESGFKILKASVQFYEKSDGQIGTYPIKSGDKAWEDLKAGGGWIAQNPQELKGIVVKKMFLGYLDPDFYQEYLQPVYVFLGDNNFVGYVSAVTDDYFVQ